MASDLIDLLSDDYHTRCATYKGTTISYRRWPYLPELINLSILKVFKSVCVALLYLAQTHVTYSKAHFSHVEQSGS